MTVLGVRDLPEITESMPRGVSRGLLLRLLVIYLPGGTLLDRWAIEQMVASVLVHGLAIRQDGLASHRGEQDARER